MQEVLMQEVLETYNMRIHFKPGNIVSITVERNADWLFGKLHSGRKQYLPLSWVFTVVSETTFGNWKWFIVNHSQSSLQG